MLRATVRSCAAAAILSLPAAGICAAAQPVGGCEPAVGRIVSIQGNIQIRRAATNNWFVVRTLDTPLCAGDSVHTGLRSRAAIVLVPQTVVRVDQNSTLQLRAVGRDIHVEMFRDADIKPAQLDNACGAGYFITRFPRSFKVYTPFLNAAVEGTEFQVALACDSAELTVLEGRVSANAVALSSSQVTLGSGQAASAGIDQPIGPVRLVAAPLDAVKWTLFYLPVTSAGKTSTSSDCVQPDPFSTARCRLAAAEDLLRTGRVQEAREKLAELRGTPEGSSDALALTAIIALVQNDKAAALASARQATSSPMATSRAWLALSYALQAHFDLDEALAASERGVALEPQNALGHARVAELRLSLGQIDAAEGAARTALSLDGASSRARSMMGFIELARLRTAQAREHFQVAIELDSTDPLPRLGMGLAVVRGGDLVAGREQIEIAVALDPGNSLLRSYLGKAFFDENNPPQDKLAAGQYAMARSLDPQDPTPDFYEALLLHARNQPAEALRRQNSSIAKNDNRAVYRSRLLLDSDLAARDSGSAALLAELGFNKLAILQATKALNEDPRNHAAHGMLAATYALLPRHDIARVSEGLQAQIHSPATLNAVDPLLTSENLKVLLGTGPTRIGINEYSSLYEREGGRIRFGAVHGSRGTVGDQLTVSGLRDGMSFSINQFHYETDGFQFNDAAQKDIVSIFLHAGVDSRSVLQLEAKLSNFKVGETFFRFDPAFSVPVVISEDSDLIRLNGRHDLNEYSALVWTLAGEDRNRLVHFIPDEILFGQTRGSAATAELQYLAHWSKGKLTSGLLHIEDTRDFPLEDVRVRARASEAYAYGQLKPWQADVRFDVGLAAEHYTRRHTSHQNEVARDRWSPKLGLTWSPRPSSTIRLTAFSSVRRPYVGGQTLEPTHVGGFNQFFSGFEQLYGDVEGTRSRRAGAALDQVIGSSVYAGVEVSRRKLAVPSINLDRDFDWREKSAQGYLYGELPRFGMLLSEWQTTASLEAEYEELDRPQILTGSEGIINLRTSRVPVGIRSFCTCGVSIKVSTAYIKQTGRFSLDEGFDIFTVRDSAWITDAAVEFKLPRRAGEFSVGVRNLSDHYIDLVETDPFNPRVSTRRLGFLKFRLVM